ncbi:hypothetical protein X777_10615 [Ooceraea biroi]|uniref:Uncharacterized protein n=1 Tax=Ooceraea biroi TaxID=2015173 RepID=A0A026W2X0_OOCBI|nr:hypothetical protein X777_10615 [Ooceraea biroi]
MKTLRDGRRVDDPRVYEESGQNKKEGDKNQTDARGTKRERRGEREVEGRVLPRERKERQSGDGRALPWDKEGVKFLGVWVVVTACPYTPVFDSWRSIIPLSRPARATFDIVRNTCRAIGRRLSSRN